MPKYLDLFAGAGGLSEGFIQAGYEPVAHVEMDTAACYTLKTRTAFHWLKEHGMEATYDEYLKGKISRKELYKAVPKEILETVLCYEISEKSISEIFQKIDAILGEERLDLIIGGPPCQAYSLVGRARDENGMLGDVRNYLYRLYAKFLKRYKPKFFVFENVKGLLSAKDEDGSLHFSNMRKLFKKMGYYTEYKVLNAYDFGVPQHRERIILIGKLGARKGNFYPDIPKVDNSSRVLVGEVLKDLPAIKAGEGNYRPVKTKPYQGKYLYEMRIKDSDRQEVTLHISRPNTEQDLRIYRLVVDLWNMFGERMVYDQLPNDLKTHKNVTSFIDRFKVVAANRDYSQTIVAHISKDGHYYIHPDKKQNRSLTPREAARLQTFPDNYYFESVKPIPGRTAAYKQIGNAVPVRLAYCIASALLPCFER